MFNIHHKVYPVDYVVRLFPLYLFFHPLHLSCTECDVLKLAIIMFIFVSYHIIKVIYVLCVYLQYCVGFSVTAK